MNKYQGDLSDIVLASGGVIRPTTAASTTATTTTTTTATTTSTTATSTSTTTATTIDEQILDWQFRSPDLDLCPFPDPFITNKSSITSTGSAFVDVGPLDTQDPHQKSSIYADHHGGVMINNFNMFSRALQISPDHHMHSNINTNSNSNNNINSNNNGNNCGLVESSSSVHEIPNSLRNSGIKRRKSQAKKVVCIPATTGANNRQSGEVVPSDLWAWRKYGQKPIKGSPYPRGYYRCSSSKGCSARKQVERSRTDPNMLVITYTSEHNHPWPTQRNALAGSSRSQPSNNITSSSKPPPILTSKEVLVVKDKVNNTETSQEKTTSEDEMRTEMQVEENGEHNNAQSYKPIMVEPNGKQPQQDLFANFGFEGDDPLNLIFTQESKKSDPFSGLFDWVAPNSSTSEVESNDNPIIKEFVDC